MKSSKFGSNSLRGIINLLREAVDEEEKGQDSIDSQLDSYFSDYEVEAKNSKVERKEFRQFVKRFLLEAEEEKEDDTADKDTEDKDEKEKSKMTIDDLDVDSFTSSVIRLVDNYDSLLEVRNTILRRAVNFLLKSYEPDVSEAFKENLSEKHGIDLGKSKAEVEDEEFQAPAADRAGAALGGA